MAAVDDVIRSIHMEPGMYGRAWERFAVNRAGRLLSIGAGLSGITARSCQLIDISKGGASMHVMTAVGLPDHYYLTIAGAGDRIGCAEVYRNNGRIGVKFIKPIDDRLLSIIIRGEFLAR